MSATLLCVLNEIADRLARDGSVQRFVRPEPFLGVSRQNVRRKIKCWTENQHLVLWCGPCSTQREARELISGPDLATRVQLLSFNRTQSRVVIGLLTGHKTLRRRLYTRVAQKVRPHIFFLGSYLFRMYEIHAQYNWMFPLHMLFFTWSPSTSMAWCQREIRACMPSLDQLVSCSRTGCFL
jgi:hypothetical protein